MMLKSIKQIFKAQPKLSTAFLLFSAVAFLFLALTINNAVYWSTHAKEAVRPWMTIGYVARSWDLDGPDIDKIAGTPLPEGRPLTIQEIADSRKVPAAEIIAKIEDAVKQLVAEREKVKLQ